MASIFIHIKTEPPHPPSFICKAIVRLLFCILWVKKKLKSIWKIQQCRYGQKAQGSISYITRAHLHGHTRKPTSKSCTQKKTNTCSRKKAKKRENPQPHTHTHTPSRRWGLCIQQSPYNTRACYLSTWFQQILRLRIITAAYAFFICQFICPSLIAGSATTQYSLRHFSKCWCV